LSQLPVLFVTEAETGFHRLHTDLIHFFFVLVNLLLWYELFLIVIPINSKQNLYKTSGKLY